MIGTVDCVCPLDSEASGRAATHQLGGSVLAQRGWVPGFPTQFQFVLSFAFPFVLKVNFYSYSRFFLSLLPYTLHLCFLHYVIY